MSPKEGAHDRLEAAQSIRPRRLMLARGPGTEARPGDEDCRARVLLMVQYEVRIIHAIRQRSSPEAGALDPLQPVRRNDLIGYRRPSDSSGTQRPRRC